MRKKFPVWLPVCELNRFDLSDDLATRHMKSKMAEL